MTRARVTLAAVAALAAVALPAMAAGPMAAAHRGGAALWPENSLLAFRNAQAPPKPPMTRRGLE